VCLAFAGEYAGAVAKSDGGGNDRFEQWVSTDWLPSVVGLMAFAYLAGRLPFFRPGGDSAVRSLIALAATTCLCAAVVPLAFHQIDRFDDGPYVLGLLAIACLALAVWTASRIRFRPGGDRRRGTTQDAAAPPEL